MYPFPVTEDFWRIFEPFHNVMGEINLFLQFTIMALIYVGVRMLRRGDLVWHGNIMLTAVLINTVSSLSFMIPALAYFYQTEPSIYPISVVHGVSGGIALILGAWITGLWAYKGSSTRRCTGKRSLMVLTLVFWSISLGLGVVVYFLDALKIQL